MARELIGNDFRVCLVESGGFEPDKATQSLYWGENIGHPYYELDTARARFFGGTSHYWHIPLGDDCLGVRLRPLDEIDFEEREWIPHSGWPFDKTHLNPFYERAQSICQLGPFTYDVEDWEDPVKTPRLPLNGGRVQTTIFQFGTRDYFFREYRDQITRAENIVTYLHANAVNIETNETARQVTRLRMAYLGGNEFWVTAKLFILAMGGIEIPRLLLLSNTVQKEGLGNQYDLVGRFFMEHPHLWSGIYIPSDPSIFTSTGLYKVHTVNNVPVMGKLTLNEEVLCRERLLNYCVSIHPKIRPNPRYHKTASKGVNSLRKLRSTVRNGNVPRDWGKLLGHVINDSGGVALNAYRKVMRRFHKIPVFLLNHMAEQAPNPSSRVTLGQERDALGQNRVQLDWHLSPIDIKSMIRAQGIIDEELRHAGLGRLRIELEDETPPGDLHGGWHHMGTTRMHVDPQKGVVDENCKVHGISNLFIAGSSVFPTGGYANPVLTIVALAIRLADHIKQVMA
jgi:choline dehydrogenase-like flavoprotein